MQLPDSVQNILAYGQGYNDGMKDGHICGFHDAIVCIVHDLTGLLTKYHEMEMEYAGLQEKARKKRLENMPQFEQPPEQKHGRWMKKRTDYGSERTCSVCFIPIRVGIGISFDIDRFAFCPFCGAKMDAGDDQDTHWPKSNQAINGGGTDAG